MSLRCPKRKLSPEIVSLVHHIELNKAGWQNQTIQQLILSALWLSEKPLNQKDIIDHLFRKCGIRTSREKIRGQIQKLVDANVLVRGNDNV